MPMAMPFTITSLTSTTMGTSEGAALYRLLTWLSPSYPVGAFAYSQGIETAVARGLIGDSVAALEWMEDSVSAGSLWSDAVIFARAHDAARMLDGWALENINGIAHAFQPTAELRLETLALGRAFLGVTLAAWPCPALDLIARIPGEDIVYPLAVAAAAAGHGVGPGPAVQAFLHAGAANLVSAAIRLVPLGQTDGQRIMARLEAPIAMAVEKARHVPLDDLSTACLMAEICCMSHETQVTRLFRS